MKRIRAEISIVVLLLSMLLLACSQTSENPFKFEDLGQNPLGIVEHKTQIGGFKELSLPYPNEEIKYSDELLIGEYGGDRSLFLLKFGTLLEKIDSVTVTGAKLFMYSRYQIPAEPQNPMQVSVHNVQINWDEETVDVAAILNNYDTGALTTFEIAADLPTLVIAELPADFVQNWLYRVTENNGLLFNVENAEFIASFYSDETVNAPYLRIFYDKEGQTDSVTVAASDGLSILSSDFQLPEDRLAVGNEINYALFFRIDDAIIPRYSTINSAVLTLTVDSTLSLYPSGNVVTLSQLPTQTENWDVNLGEVDSTSVDTTQYRGGEQIRINITYLLQKWVNNETENHGLRLTPRYPGNELFRLVFYASSVADSSLRPRLDIYYTKVPDFGR